MRSDEGRFERGHSRGLVYLIIYLLALGIGFHLGTVLVYGGIFLLFLLVKEKAFGNAEIIVYTFGFAVILADMTLHRSFRRDDRGAPRARRAGRVEHGEEGAIRARGDGASRAGDLGAPVHVHQVAPRPANRHSGSRDVEGDVRASAAGAVSADQRLRAEGAASLSDRAFREVLREPVPDGWATRCSAP